MIDLFVYGSLMKPEVWNEFASRTYEAVPMAVKAYRKVALDGWDYPGVVEDESSSVQGILYVNVIKEDIASLDEYEGSEYRRVQINQGGRTFQLYKYIGPRNIIF